MEDHEELTKTATPSSSTSTSDASPTPRSTVSSQAASSMAILRLLMGSENPSTPRETATMLHDMAHSDPQLVGQVVGEPDAKAQQVLREYANLFEFQGVTFDVALRVYLGRFELPPEAQKIDRILQAFAKAYYSSNPDSFECPSEDAAYTLAFSVLLLNTDAHNPKLARKFKMTRADFIRNYHRLGAGESGSARAEVPDVYLGQCYDLFVMDGIRHIEQKPIELLPDEVELEFPDTALGLEIETSFDGRTAVVKRYFDNRHTYSSKRQRQSSSASSTASGSSFLTSGANLLAAGSSFLANIFATIDPEPETSIEGWVIVAVGDDSTRQIGYKLSRYLLKTAPRPVLVRFCEPSVYFASLV